MNTSPSKQHSPSGRPQRASVIRKQEQINTEQADKELQQKQKRQATVAAQTSKDEIAALRQQVKEKVGAKRDKIEDIPNRLASRASSVQAAFDWLNGKREQRVKNEALNATKSKPSRLRELIPLDSALAILLYAHESYAVELAERILGGTSDELKVEAAETEGRIFWDGLIRQIVSCPQTPESTPLSSDAGSEDAGAEELNNAAVGLKENSRQGQSTLSKQLHCVHLGSDPVTKATSGPWHPPDEYVRAWADIVLNHEERVFASGLVASHVLRYALIKDSSEVDLAWNLLSRFCGCDLTKFKSTIQHTQNAWLTTPDVDKLFDTYKIVLEPILPPEELYATEWLEHDYDCHVTILDPLADLTHSKYPPTITFKNHYTGSHRSSHRLPLPYLLHIHSLLGRVFQLKAMAEHIDFYLRDLEEVDEVEETDLVEGGSTLGGSQLGMMALKA